MSIFKHFHFSIFFMFFIFSNLLCQVSEIDKTDFKIFRVITDNKAFLNWQKSWIQLWPEFDIFNFNLESDKNITLIPVRNITIADIQKKNHLLLTFFSPNGLKAIDPFSYYEVTIRNNHYSLGKDDFNSIRLYDFSTDTAYTLQDLSNYGPYLNGIAWLSDDLVVMVGWNYRELNNQSEHAPLIFVFDLGNMKVRKYVGKYFPAKQVQKFKVKSFTNEVKLIFEYNK